MKQGQCTFERMGARELTEEQLEGMARHFVYEKRMWQWTWDALARMDHQAPPPHPDQAWRNALIESHLLHLRALTEFFSPRKNPRTGDVFATDYFPSWSAGSEGAQLLASMPSLNKRVGHLTLSRMQHETRKEDESAWYEGPVPMMELLKRFEEMFGEKERTWFNPPLSA
jgi:hypothetical protein